MRHSGLAVLNEYELPPGLLARRGRDERQATFAGGEGILRLPLCDSACAYRPWRAEAPAIHRSSVGGWQPDGKLTMSTLAQNPLWFAWSR